MNVTLTNLMIRNFKGIREMDIAFDSQTVIAGRNNVGKTSIADAFAWLLLNKSIHGATPDTHAFSVKPVDGSGNVIHNLQTSVEVLLHLDGAPLRLKRIQSENWVKPRGKEDAKFKADESTYSINDVVVLLKEYKQRLSILLVDEKLLTAIVSPVDFNTNDMKKRREILFSMIDSNIDDKLLMHDEYAPIVGILNEHSISLADVPRWLANQKKAIEAELQLIPARIDEKTVGRPDITEDTIANASYIIKDTQKTIGQIDETIASMKAADGRQSKLDQLAAMKNELASIERAAANEYESERRAFGIELCGLRSERDQLSRQYESLTGGITLLRKSIIRQTAERDTLRKQHTQVYELQFDPSSAENVCHACGQSIPEDRLQATFAQHKKVHLDEIKSKGISLNEQIAQSESGVSDMDQEIKSIKEQLDKASMALSEKEKKCNPPSAESRLTHNPHYAELQEQILVLQHETEMPTDDKIATFESRRQELSSMIARAQETLAKAEVMKSCDERIAELQNRQKEYGTRQTAFEKLLMLYERFVKARCEHLETEINNLFPMLRWRLFDIQKNEGVRDTCVCLVPNTSTGAMVTYDGANTGAKINANIEIASVLAAHFGVTMPLFVDCTESVNELIPYPGQLIALKVTNDKELTIITGDKEAA